MQNAIPHTPAEREYLQQIFMQAPAMIAILRGPDFVFELANPLYMQSVGPNRKILGKPLLVALPEVQNHQVVAILQEVYRTGQPYVGNEVLVPLDRRGNGTLEDAFFNFVYQPLKDADGKVNGIFVHALEVTQLVAARHKAENLATELEAVFDSIPEGVYIADQTGIHRTNRRGAELIGYDEPAQVPSHITALADVLDLRFADTGKKMPHGKSALVLALKGQKVQYDRLVTHDTKGKRRMLRVAAAPIHDAHKQVIGAVAISSDITERTRLEEKLHRDSLKQKLLNQKAAMLSQQNNELKQLNKSKDEFIALASHQLRTPATGVKQYVGMLLEGYMGDISPDQRNFLEKAYESNERQLSTINDLLQIAQIDANKIVLNRVRCDVAALVDAVKHEQMANIKRRRQTIIVKKDSATVEAFVDQPRLRMVLDNLIDNASKYSRDNTTITVTVGGAARNLVVSVADQGVGIAQKDRPKLFQKFSRIDNPLSIAVGGNGLGLYLAKRIIDAHNGSIEVTSVPQKGTIFTVALPLAEKV